jgi:hypothetical protein
MAVQATHMYDSGYEAMFDNGESPTDATAGAYHWLLATSSYTPNDTHSTTTDVTNQVTGDGAAIAATNLEFLASPGAANESFFQAGTTAGGAGVVQFGPNVTITARYLILVKNTTPPTFSATTSELIFFIDLTGSASDLSSSNGDFTITMPTSGWYKVSQA